MAPHETGRKNAERAHRQLRVSHVGTGVRSDQSYVLRAWTLRALPFGERNLLSLLQLLEADPFASRHVKEDVLAWGRLDESEALVSQPLDRAFSHCSSTILAGRPEQLRRDRMRETRERSCKDTIARVRRDAHKGPELRGRDLLGRDETRSACAFSAIAISPNRRHVDHPFRSMAIGAKRRLCRGAPLKG